MTLHVPQSQAGYYPPSPLTAHINAQGADGYSIVGTLWSDETTFPFPQDLLKYTDIASDLELVWDPGRDYKAWAVLNVANSTIIGSGSMQVPVRFVARKDVHVTGEFHAGGASEVHLLTEETFPNCNNPYYGMVPKPPSTTSEPKNIFDAEEVLGRLEIRFQPAYPMIRTFPNPCMDQLTITSTLHVPITVFDAHGAIIFQAAKQMDDLTIDTANWSPGNYVVQLVALDGSVYTSHINKVR